MNKETGEAMEFEILLSATSFERIVLPYTKNLKQLGIDARVRLVDRSQYVNRVRNHDFDIILGRMGTVCLAR